MSVNEEEKNLQHKYILRSQQKLLTEAVVGEEQKITLHEDVKYISNLGETLIKVSKISQTDVFRKFFLEDAIVDDTTNVKIANTLIICVGAISGGKSYTIFGSSTDSGLAFRIITALFQSSKKYNSNKISINMSVVEHSKGKLYDLLEKPKIIKNKRNEFKSVLVMSEKHGHDIVNSIGHIRSKTTSKYRNRARLIHHTSDVVIKISTESSSVSSPYINYADIYLMDMEAFDEVHSDNMRSLENINRKFSRIKDFSKFQVKVIGTVMKRKVQFESKSSSVLYLMKCIRDFMAKSISDDGSVFCEKENLKYLKTTLEDKLYEMNGILKLVTDRSSSVRSNNIVRNTDEFMKRLLLAYVHDKVEEATIINMSVHLDAQFIFQMCKDSLEELKLEKEKKQDVFIKQFEDSVSSEEEEEEDEEEEDNEEEEEDDDSDSDSNDKEDEDIDKITNLEQLKDPTKVKPIAFVWKKFMESFPNLKFTMEHYRKGLNELQKTLNKKEKAFKNIQSVNDTQKCENLAREIIKLETLITLTRKNILQTYKNCQDQYDKFCEDNNYISLPEIKTDDMDLSDPSIVVHLINQKTENLKSTDWVTFDSYLNALLTKEVKILRSK